MQSEGECGCGHHGGHHGENQEHTGHGRGCGEHGHHGAYRGEAPHPGCACACHQSPGYGGFRRHFVSSEEVAGQLEEYLKELRAEAKGVEEQLAELKKKGESAQG